MAPLFPLYVNIKSTLGYSFQDCRTICIHTKLGTCKYMSRVIKWNCNSAWDSATWNPMQIRTMSLHTSVKARHKLTSPTDC